MIRLTKTDPLMNRQMEVIDFMVVDALTDEVVYPTSLQWDPIVAQIDRPILVLKGSVRPR